MANNTRTMVSQSAGVYECLIVPPSDSNKVKFPNTYIPVLLPSTQLFEPIQLRSSQPWRIRNDFRAEQPAGRGFFRNCPTRALAKYFAKGQRALRHPSLVAKHKATPMT